MASLSFDPAAVRAAAHRIDAVAEAARDTAARLGGLQFEGSVAGRGHPAVGAALRAELNRLAADVTGWAVAAAELAAVLSAGAATHASTEVRAATVLR